MQGWRIFCGLVFRVSGYRSRCPRFDFRHFQIFWEAAGLERGPLSLVRTTEKLLERKIAAALKETEINDRGNPLQWPRDTLYPQKLALTSPTSGGRSVVIVRSRTKATEFRLVFRAEGFMQMWQLKRVHIWPLIATAVDTPQPQQRTKELRTQILVISNANISDCGYIPYFMNALCKCNIYRWDRSVIMFVDFVYNLE
jgi:hypothetical protein